MAYVVTDSCIQDSLCVEVCPTDSIHPKQDEPGFEAATQMYVNPEGCIDCGACIPACTSPQLKGDGFTVNQAPPTPSNCVEPRSTCSSH